MARRGVDPGVVEAFYDPLGSYDSGSFGGPIGNHDDHVHISFGTPRVALYGIRLAQKMGLSVRENPYTDTVDPVHTDTSYHYRTFPGEYNGKKLGQAIDVSGDPAKMAAFYEAMTATQFRGRAGGKKKGSPPSADAMDPMPQRTDAPVSEPQAQAPMISPPSYMPPMPGGGMPGVGPMMPGSQVYSLDRRAIYSNWQRLAQTTPSSQVLQQYAQLSGLGLEEE